MFDVDFEREMPWSREHFSASKVDEQLWASNGEATPSSNTELASCGVGILVELRDQGPFKRPNGPFKRFEIRPGKDLGYKRTIRSFTLTLIGELWTDQGPLNLRVLYSVKYDSGSDPDKNISSPRETSPYGNQPTPSLSTI